MRKSKYDWVTKEFLEIEHHQKGKSLCQIGREQGIPKGSMVMIARYLDFNNRSSDYMYKFTSLNLTPGKLKKLYKTHSIKELAKMFKCRGVTVFKWLKKFGIQTRPAHVTMDRHKKTAPESKVEELLFNLFPSEYKYVGDGSFTIDAFNPDFINVNSQKKLIEIFGDYWHNLPSYKKRDWVKFKVYKKYGWKYLVIWESELKNINKVKKKLICFHNT